MIDEPATIPATMHVPVLLTTPDYWQVDVMAEDLRRVAQLAYALIVSGVPVEELLARLSGYREERG